MGRNLCIIPARGGSKRIPKKNIRVFLGKPIIAYSIETAIKSKLFDKIIVSTDDEDIAKIALEYNASVPFFRSLKSSSDEATTLEVLKEVLNQLLKANHYYENICCLYPCSPLTSQTHLKQAYEKFLIEGLDTLVSIQKYSHPIQRALKIDSSDKIIFHKPEYISTRTQDLSSFYHDAGQFYFHKNHLIKNSNDIYQGSTGYYELNDCEAQDIDNEDDWAMAELKYKQRQL
ncbi:MAG: pseudaminic acid cytidylyltransferase [Flavobacteriaceae bacterium]